MANIFQKIFLPKSQLVVLDFIDKHADSVRYCLAENMHYTWHNMLIESSDFTLKAYSRQDAGKNSSGAHIVFYFTCNNKSDICNEQNCAFKKSHGITAHTILDSDGFISNDEIFALRVYNKMMKNYNKIKSKQAKSDYVK